MGVGKGASANFIAENLTGRPDMTLHALQLRGPAEAWHGTHGNSRQLRAGGSRSEVSAKRDELHKGWFSETLPRCKRNPKRQDFAVACSTADLYSSTATVLAHAGALLQPGSIVVFDEYFNYHGWQKHEFKAWQEFAAERQVKYAYRGFSCRGGHVSLRIKEIGRAALGSDQ